MSQKFLILTINLTKVHYIICPFNNIEVGFFIIFSFQLSFIIFFLSTNLRKLQFDKLFNLYNQLKNIIKEKYLYNENHFHRTKRKQDQSHTSNSFRQLTSYCIDSYI